MIEPRNQQLVQMLWTDGRLSRWELHQKTGITPTRVGAAVDILLREGLVRECTPKVLGSGRPRVPLEIDPARRHVIGLALVPGKAEACRLGLRGTVIGRPVVKAVSDPSRLVAAGASLLSELCTTETLGVGASLPGFVDPVERTILFSSALGGGPTTSLAAVYQAAGTLPIVLENDMHALAARWLLTHRADQQHDVLLVYIADGRVGAAILIDGRPNSGCAIGGNELGHSRFPIRTKRCFCGHTGCLERIVSTDFLHDRDRPQKPGKAAARSNAEGGLNERIAAFAKTGDDPALDNIMEYLALALGNAINFVRPHRMVLVSEFVRNVEFGETMSRLTRAMLLPGLAERVTFDLWDQAARGSAETAAWLGMAELLYGGWNQSHSAGSRQGRAGKNGPNHLASAK
jgi:predicted NBD/HSP70 family sugar kinase